MKRTFLFVILLVGFVLSFNQLYAQKPLNYLTGTVYDENNGEALPYVTITCPCLSEAVLTDADGNFEVATREDECDFTFFLATFSEQTHHVSFDSKHRKIYLRVELEPYVNGLEGVKVVTTLQDNDPYSSVSSITKVSP